MGLHRGLRACAWAGALALGVATTAPAGPIYKLRDLGPIGAETDLARTSTASGWVTDSQGQIVAPWDKSPLASPDLATAPYAEQVIEDRNAAGLAVGTEAYYHRPKPPGPGQVAIDSIRLQHHAALVTGSGRWVDLNRRFHRLGWTLQSADHIDDRGRIVGQGTLDGVEHAYLLLPRNLRCSPLEHRSLAAPEALSSSGTGQPIPAPEPATFALFGVAAVVVFRRRGR